MHKQRKQLKVYRDEVKERFTSHWDLDYMTSAQLEEAMAAVHRPQRPKAALLSRTLGAIRTALKRVLAFRRGSTA